VVDLGCGSGRWASELNRAGFDEPGIDQSLAVIALARRIAPKSQFKVASVLKTGPPPGDAITSAGVNYCFDESNNRPRARTPVPASLSCLAARRCPCVRLRHPEARARTRSARASLIGPRMEGATSENFNSREESPESLPSSRNLGNGGDQCLRVGMLRSIQYLIRRTYFDEAACLHDGNTR
jgi:SAM-dependent methyltransferase